MAPIKSARSALNGYSPRHVRSPSPPRARRQPRPRTETATDPLKEGSRARQATEDAGALASQDYLGAKARLDGIVVSLSALLQASKTDAGLPAKSEAACIVVRRTKSRSLARIRRR
jgi:hypothetical protein